MPDLIVELNNAALVTPIIAGGLVMVTPPIDEDFWLLRVAVSKRQAVVAFPKFTTIGVGFQHERDWNTNLPWAQDAAEIYAHISHNRRGASPARCLAAIRLLQQRIRANDFDTPRNAQYDRLGRDA